MYFVISLIIICIFTLLFWNFIKNKRVNELLSKIPSPKSYPLINHSGYFLGKTPEGVLKVLQNFSKSFGPVWWIKIATDVSVFVEDPKILEEVLSSQKWIQKSFDYDLFIEWLGDGLLISRGQKWHERRKIITPAFHFKILEHFVEVMEKHGEIFADKIQNFENQDINVFPLVSLYALDVICETAMGYELNAQQKSDSDYVKAVKEMTQILWARVFDISRRVKFIYQFTADFKREKGVIKTLHTFTKNIIEKRKNYNEKYGNNFENDTQSQSSSKKKLAFLDLLLHVQKDYPGKLDDDGIREEVDTFMFEGHDTTTSAISFALLNLAKYPDIQQIVFEECQSILGDEKLSKIQQLNQLTYMEKFIKESLRLYPSVPMIGRSVKEEFTIGDFTFPAGITMNIPALFMGRDPKIFPDPLKFDPLRFEQEDRNPFAYIPFSAGPRNCIGQKFAMLEIKSVLSQIVKRFEISVKKENEEPIEVIQMILRPKDGIILNFKKRN